VTGTLHFAGAEAGMVARSRPDADTVPAGGTEEFLSECQGASVVHLACHGTFNADNPYLSGLLAFPDDPGDLPGASRALTDYAVTSAAPRRRYRLLTVAEIMARCRLPACRLVVLSACRSGLPRQHAADEFTSLPGAFLMAGARGVIASLWPVDDAATYLLMDAFYAAWAGGRGEVASPAAALRVARQRLARLTREEVRERVGDGAHVPGGDCPYADVHYTMPFQYYGVE
jgi:CHAT domain-containing protein